MARRRTNREPELPPAEPDLDVAMADQVPAAEPFALLQAFLTEINGQDSYDAKTAAIGKLAPSKYLKVPIGLAPLATAPADIGSVAARNDITRAVYAQIYVLNKAVFETPDAQIKGALLRAEMVRIGWYTSGYEVTEVAAPVDAEATMNADLPRIREVIADASMLALLLPLAAEHTFRTMGHHFLTSMEADYVAKYNRFFNACVMGKLVEYLPPAVLYHTVAHWVSLELALAVVKDNAQAAKLPNAVIVRSKAAPAGMALVTTSHAVMEAIAGTGLLVELQKACGLDTTVIATVSNAAKADPARFHTIPMAYGRGLLARADVDTIEAAKTVARKLAPVFQGFIDALPRSSDLAQARALIKHADVNPMLRKRAKVFFQEVGKSKAASMADLFSMDKRVTADVAEEEVDEAE